MRLKTPQAPDVSTNTHDTPEDAQGSPEEVLDASEDKGDTSTGTEGETTNTTPDSVELLDTEEDSAGGRRLEASDIAEEEVFILSDTEPADDVETDDTASEGDATDVNEDTAEEDPALQPSASRAQAYASRVLSACRKAMVSRSVPFSRRRMCAL